MKRSKSTERFLCRYGDNRISKGVSATQEGVRSDLLRRAAPALVPFHRAQRPPCASPALWRQRPPRPNGDHVPIRYPCVPPANWRGPYAAHPSRIRPESTPTCAHKSSPSNHWHGARRGANTAFFRKRNIIALPHIIQTEAFHHQVMQGCLAGFNQREGMTPAIHMHEIGAEGP